MKVYFEIVRGRYHAYWLPHRNSDDDAVYIKNRLREIFNSVEIFNYNDIGKTTSGVYFKFGDEADHTQFKLWADMNLGLYKGGVDI